ncbi:hypothetical protein PN36_01835 [Candidatus Thiomargarita nelsonii]|uniref:GmrSD restriction endonucleases N-terminal domain-containing protein n=1 Tax=Candidatus Thiomargarita nelsonii TaxID=1003181 RepID=A0A0A6P9X4_9GAMM|nr:hypothetical protein PN36_01835 [Candidatus Thiomargarita nelsonii]
MSQDQIMSEPQKREILNQLEEMQRKVDYDVQLSSITSIVEEFRDNILRIPKSTLVWSKRQQMRLIEMAIMGLPIPSIVVLFTGEYPYDEEYEVLDGTQRVLTLEAFMSNRLRLENLEILTSLNGFSFSDIHFIQRNKFKSRILKMIVIEKTVPRDMAREIAMRIDSGGTPLADN